MSEEMKVEGIAAKFARELRGNLGPIMDSINDNSQVIIIVTDLTGKSPTQVHIQGPSKDPVLLHGMLGVASNIVNVVNAPRTEKQDQA